LDALYKYVAPTALYDPASHLPSFPEYFWKVIDAQVTFVKDEQGKATKAIHHQGGRVFDAPKIE
jgi:hypothetical protein